MMVSPKSSILQTTIPLEYLNDEKVDVDEEAQIKKSLFLAADKAKYSLNMAKRHRNALQRIILEYEETVGKDLLVPVDLQPEAIRPEIVSFREEYNRLRTVLSDLMGKRNEMLSHTYEALERDSRFVTIMLFGRTMAGKSTTMEALTGGDGSSIGEGAQHTTKQVTAYYYPSDNGEDIPDYPCLRIIDTPGIEGFKGEELAAMAEGFIDRTDHIFFLISDDKISSGELEKFSDIHSQGKNITVLLNIKSSDQDLDLLVNSPEYVFKDAEIQGHKRRIERYLKDHFDINAPIVIPFHARSAWLSRSGEICYDDMPSIEEIEKASRILDVERHIANFILEESVYCRIRTPRDLLYSYIWSLKQDLRPFAGSFRAMTDSLDELERHIRKGIQRSRKRIDQRFPLLYARFKSASDGIPGLVDELITNRMYGDAFGIKWREYQETHGVTNAVSWFIDAGICDFKLDITEEIRVATTDIEYQVSSGDDLNELFHEYQNKEDSLRNNKYKRVAIRASAGTATTALAAWAVTNFWNPSGWLAAAGTLASIGVGIAAEEYARKETGTWEKADKQLLFTQRSQIIKSLREHLWDDYRNADKVCRNWLQETVDIYNGTVNNDLSPIRTTSTTLWTETVGTMRRLDEVAMNSNEELITEIFCNIVPAVASEKVKIVKVVREPRVATKVLLDTQQTKWSALGLCIGANGLRIKRIKEALGGEPVHLIDYKAPSEERITQALGLSKHTSGLQVIAEDNSYAKVIVPGKLVKQTIGIGGSNVRLASQLLNMKIKIVEGKNDY